MGITITKDLLNPQTNLQEEVDEKKEPKKQGITINPYHINYQPDRTFFDSMNFTNIYTDPLHKYTKYDVTPTRFIDWDETRAQNQSTGEKWLNGLTKAGVTTLGAIAENTLGVLFGLGELVSGGAYYDNWVGHTVDGANEWMREAMPNYMTQAEREYTTMQKLGTANFWADTVANGFGYSLGSLATMALTGGAGMLTRGATLAARGARAMNMYNTTKNIVNATKIGEKLAKGSRMAGFKNAVGTVEAGLMMSLAESSVEARETQRNVYEDLVNKALIENNLTDESQLSQAHREELLQVSYAAGNRDFLTQLPILAGTNLLMFGRHVAGFKAANKVNKDIAYDTATNQVVNSVAKHGKYRKAFEKVRPTLGGMATEAGQEGWQFASKVYSSDYHTNKYYNGGAADLISSMSKGITDLFGTQEGLESMLVGAIVGGGMSGGRSLISKPYEQRKRIAEYATAVLNGGYLNNAADKTLNLNAMSLMAEEMERARKAGDIKAFKDAQYKLVQLHALSNIENGTFDVMMQKLTDTKGLSDKDFAKLFGFDPEVSIKDQTKTENNPEGKSKSDIIEQFKTKLNEFKNDHEKINELFPPVLRSSPVKRMFMSPEEREAEDATFQERDRLRKELILSVSGIKDRNKRLKAIQEKMQTILAEASAVNGVPMIEEDFRIYPMFQKDEELTDIPDVEKDVTSRAEELEAVRKKLLNKAAELKNAGALAAVEPFTKEAQDYLSLYAENLKSIKLYNQLSSDEYFRKFFNDAVAEKEGAARQRANNEANEKNIEEAKEVKDVQVSDDANQEVKNKAEKKKRELKDKEDQATRIWLKSVKKLSPKKALEKLLLVDPTALDNDAKRAGLQRAIEILKKRIEKADKKDPRKKPKTSEEAKVEGEVDPRTETVVEEMDLEPTEEQKIIEEMNLEEEPEDGLTINESNIILDENKENTKKKTPPKRPVKDPAQLDLFTEEDTEVVPDKPVSEDELEIQLATNVGEVVGNWNIPVDEDGNIVEPDPDTVTEGAEIDNSYAGVFGKWGNIKVLTDTAAKEAKRGAKSQKGVDPNTLTYEEAQKQFDDMLEFIEKRVRMNEVLRESGKPIMPAKRIIDEVFANFIKAGVPGSILQYIVSSNVQELKNYIENRVEQGVVTEQIVENPIVLNKDLLLNDNIIGTEVEFEIIENDWYLSDREDKAAEPWMEVPIYVKIGDQYIGKLQASQNEERKAIVEKLQKGERVTTSINSIKSNNFNNTRTADNVEEVVFRDPREVFGNNDDVLLVHTVAIKDGDTISSQWSLGEVHPDKDKGDLNKIKVNIEDEQDIQQNQIGIVIRSKHNPQPIDRIAYLSTANLSDNAKLKVLEALENRDFDKASEIVASSIIRTNAENNPSFLQFGSFTPITDKSGKVIPGEDWMIYYSPALGKLIRIKETELVKAFNGNKAYFNEVRISRDEKITISNKYDTDRIDIDIKQDLTNFLETKKYNVIRSVSNLKSPYISPVTGYEYPTYQDYLFDEKEIGEPRTLGRGHHSILSTDIIKKGESMFNNPQVKFGKGNVLENTAPEIIKKAKIDKTKPETPEAPVDSQIKKVTLKELRELTKKTDGLSENTEDYFYIDDTFNEKGYKGIQVKKGRFLFDMSVDLKGAIKPWKVSDLREDKRLYYEKTVDGAGRIQKSSPDFPITEAEKVLTEIQNLAKPLIALEAPIAPVAPINIYAGTGENTHLSNFASRPFTNTILGEFNTVEGAFQAAKNLYTTDKDKAHNNSIVDKLQTATGAQAKALGRQIKGLDIKRWDEAAPRIMKDLIRESFEQNPDALQKLLATGNAELTHKQDKSKWGKLFPKILMEVRNELGVKVPSDTKIIKKSDNSQINDLFDNLGGIDPTTGKPRIC